MMNTGKKIILSVLIIILVTTVLVSALPFTPPAGETLDDTPPVEGAAAPAQVEMAPGAGLAVDLRRDKNGKEVVNGASASLIELVELVEFHSRKYFKLAIDYLFEFLNSLGIFPPEDLASGLNQVDRKPKKEAALIGDFARNHADE